MMGEDIEEKVVLSHKLDFWVWSESLLWCQSKIKETEEGQRGQSEEGEEGFEVTGE